MCFGEDQRALRALVPPRHAAVVALGVITEIGFSLERLVWTAVGARVPFRTLMLIRVVILQRPSIYQDHAMLVRIVTTAGCLFPITFRPYLRLESLFPHFG